MKKWSKWQKNIWKKSEAVNISWTQSPLRANAVSLRAAVGLGELRHFHLATHDKRRSLMD